MLFQITSRRLRNGWERTRRPAFMATSPLFHIPDKAMLKCILPCLTVSGKLLLNRGHWHCSHCLRPFDRKNALILHLKTHVRVTASAIPRNLATADRMTQKSNKINKQSIVVSAESKLLCPECCKCYPNSKALQRHLREQHKRKVEAFIGPGRYLKGICVDFEKGLFMISRTFSGPASPIHCQHKTHANDDPQIISSACELEDCMDAAQVARRSGHPAFECVHLQSVQYAIAFDSPPPLLDESLDDITGGQFKWFTEKRKASCLSQRDKATQAGSPLIVRFPNEISHSCRTVYLSVYDGGIHYWSRFGRVIVSYDSQMGHWSCRCCRAKISCIHKAVSKWFLYQEDEICLESSGDEEQVLDQEDDEANLANLETISNQSGKACHSYPPSGKGFCDMVFYQLDTKRIPADVPMRHLEVLPSTLEPREQECCHCKNALSGPYQITARAMIIDLTKVKKGNVTLNC